MFVPLNTLSSFHTWKKRRTGTVAESGMDNPHWHPWSRIQVQVQGLTNDPKKGKGHGSEERKETGEGIHEDRIVALLRFCWECYQMDKGTRRNYVSACWRPPEGIRDRGGALK